MKKILLFGTILVTLTPFTFAQSPQAPDKNPPIALAAPNKNPPIALAAPQSVAVATPQYVPRVVAVPQASYQIVQVAQPYVMQQVAYTQANHCTNRQAFVGANRFAAIGANQVVGNGVSITATDKKGTQVAAVGRKVRIQRGLLGRINGAKSFN